MNEIQTIATPAGGATVGTIYQGVNVAPNMQPAALQTALRLRPGFEFAWVKGTTTGGGGYALTGSSPSGINIGGNYTQSTDNGGTYNGKTLYRNTVKGYYLMWDGTRWIVCDVALVNISDPYGWYGDVIFQAEQNVTDPLQITSWYDYNYGNNAIPATVSALAGAYNSTFEITIPDVDATDPPASLPNGWTATVNQQGSQPGALAGYTNSYTTRYLTDGDTNGAIYRVGTKAGQQAFTNPHTADYITVLGSSKLDANQNPAMLVDRVDNYFHTGNDGTANQVIFDFKPWRRLLLNGFALKQRPDTWETQATSLLISGSNDGGATWVDIATVALAYGANLWNFVPINGQTTAYRFIRLRSLANSSNPGYFTANSVEFYGTIYSNTEPTVDKPAAPAIDASNPLNTGRVGYYLLHEGNGATTANLVAPASPATINAAVWANRPNGDPYLQFNGTTAMVDTGQQLHTDGSSLTIRTIGQLSAYPTNTRTLIIRGKNGSGTGYGLQIKVDSNGKVIGEYHNGTARTITSDVMAPIGRPFKVAFVVDRTNAASPTLRLIVEGVVKSASSTSYATAMRASTVGYRIGDRKDTTSTEYWPGYCDAMLVDNTPKTWAELQDWFANPYAGLSVAAAPPAAPVQNALTVGNAQLTANWQAVSGATGYNVKMATASGGPFTTVAGGANVQGTSLQITGLTNFQPKWVVVTALNAAGESPNSNEQTATPVAPMAQITAPTEGATIPRNTTITWNDVGAEGYALWVGSVPDANDLGGAEFGPGTTQHSPPTLPLGATVYLRLFTKWGGAYDFDHTHRVTATTPAPPPPTGVPPTPVLDTKTQTMGRLEAISMPANATSIRVVYTRNGGQEITVDAIPEEMPLIQGLASGDVVVVQWEATGPGGTVRSASLTFNPSPGVPDIPVVEVTPEGVYRVQPYKLLVPGAQYYRLLAKRHGEPDGGYFMVRDNVPPNLPLEINGMPTPEAVFAWMAIGIPQGGTV